MCVAGASRRDSASGRRHGNKGFGQQALAGPLPPTEAGRREAVATHRAAQSPGRPRSLTATRNAVPAPVPAGREPRYAAGRSLSSCPSVPVSRGIWLRLR